MGFSGDGVPERAGKGRWIGRRVGGMGEELLLPENTAIAVGKNISKWLKMTQNGSKLEVAVGICLIMRVA